MPVIEVYVLTIEQAIIKAGNGHSFQIRALIFIGLQYIVAGVLNIAVTEVFFYRSQFKCLDENDAPYQCSESQFCTQLPDKPQIIGLVQFGDVVKSFDLYCGKQLYIFVLITAYFIGGAMGSLYYGEMMEKRQGRYYVMIETLLMMGISCCVSLFSPTAFLLSAALFASNFFQRGFLNSSMILFFEISSLNLQKLGPPVLLACFGVGELLGPYLMQLLHLGWREAMPILIGGPAIALSILIKFMKESPRMLIVKRKFEDARWVINYICAVNGRKMPENWVLEDEAKIIELKEKMKELINTDQQIQEQPKTYNYSSIFRYNSLRVRMFCLIYLYAVIVLSQYVTSSEIQRFSKMTKTQTFIFLGSIETVGFLGSAYAALNYERKQVIKYILILGGFFNFLIASLPLLMLNANSKEFIGLYDRLVYTLVMMILVMCRLTLSFGYAFIIVIFNSYYFFLNFYKVYSLEVFPTSLRHYGFSGLVFISEFLFIFEETYVNICHSIGLNSCLGVVGLLIIGQWTMAKLRETYDQPLKENAEEMQDELLNNIYNIA